MAAKHYTGAAIARAQVSTYTVGGTVEVGDKFKTTLTAEDGSSTQTVSWSATTTSTSTTATEIAAAINNAATPSHSTYLGLFAGVSAQASGSTVIVTAVEEGVPFFDSITTTESDDSPADDQTFTRSATTANRGPSDWNSLDNWSDGALPANSDTVFLDARALAHIRYGLNQSGVTLTLLVIDRSFSKDLGQLANISGLAVKNFKLRISATTVRIGEPSGDGGATVNYSQLILLDTGSNLSTWLVAGTAQSGRNGLAPVNLKGTHASNTLSVSGDTAVVAVGVVTPGEACTVLTTINGATTGRVTLGTNCTLTDVITDGSAAQTVINSATSGTTTGVKCVRGHAYTWGSVAHQLVLVAGGVVHCNNRNGGVAVVTLKMTSPDAQIDFRGNNASLAITSTPFVAQGARLYAATKGQVTHSDGAVAYSDSGHAGYGQAPGSPD